MPAEWEPHKATWIAWPHEKTDWPGKFEPIAWVYCDIVRHLAAVERVAILISDSKAERIARRMLVKTGVEMAAVDFFPIPTDRSWTRDYCPIFVRDRRGKLAVTNWQFNAWAKYPNWKTDDAVPSAVAKALGLPEITPALRGRRIVLEGGSIDVNGRGVLLTTEECLLSDVQARNPGLTRPQLEQVFERYLGIRKTLWLRNGIAGDDTHGHIDDLARFVKPSTVVVAAETDKSEVNYEPLRENLLLLRRMTDEDGRPLEIVKLPMPRPIYFDRQRLPASYANFYIANGLVLAPTFNDPNDRIALNILSRLFPNRRVCGIHCGDLVLGLGTLHCMTQQQPALRLTPD
jgi:agmatine deiminase